jgi:hypothetical protein
MMFKVRNLNYGLKLKNKYRFCLQFNYHFKDKIYFHGLMLTFNVMVNW